MTQPNTDKCSIRMWHDTKIFLLSLGYVVGTITAVVMLFYEMYWESAYSWLLTEIWCIHRKQLTMIDDLDELKKQLVASDFLKEFGARLNSVKEDVKREEPPSDWGGQV